MFPSSPVRPRSRRVSDSSRRGSACRRQGVVPSPSPRRVSVSHPPGSLPLNNHPPSPSGLADFGDGRKSNQLGLRKKVYEFYTAPVTKFWSFTVRAALVRAVREAGWALLSLVMRYVYASVLGMELYVM